MSSGRTAAAIAWSGGKDSTLALARARDHGIHVTHAFNLYEASTGLVRFHGVPAGWIARQTDALGLELVQEPVGPEGFATTFETALSRLEDEGVEITVFGNIHLQDVSDWYRLRTTGAGFRHVEPLWDEAPGALVREFLERGFRTVVTSVNLELGDPAWLGREMDAALLADIEGREGVDPAGEKGEYHSFAFDGPGFDPPLEPRFTGEREIDGHRFLEFALLADDSVGGGGSAGADAPGHDQGPHMRSSNPAR